MDVVDAWRARGSLRSLRGRDVFVVDVPARDERQPPVLLLHGFPTSSFDWRHVVDRLAEHRRVLALDFLGFGSSAKPDEPYLLTEQADLAQSLVVSSGIDEVDLVTHDMGDTVGGELLARSLDDELPFTVRRRVLSNGSIYIEMASLRRGQKLLLALGDRALPLSLPAWIFYDGMREIFGPDTLPSDEELDAQWALLRREGGDRVMPRVAQYIRQRQRRQERWTGAIERHRSPLRIVWGALDPVALVSMAGRLAAAVPDAELVVLERIGHFPMIEAPRRFTEELLTAFDA